MMDKLPRPMTAGTISKGGTNPPLLSNERPPPPQGSGSSHDLLQTLKGNEIWLDQAKQWAPKEMHRYFDEQIRDCIAMYNAVLRLGIDHVRRDTERI